MSLCWKCQEIFKQIDFSKLTIIEAMPWLSCHHHEDKPKCWCEKYHYETDFANGLRVGNHPIRYCIECGKKLEDM